MWNGFRPLMALVQRPIRTRPRSESMPRGGFWIPSIRRRTRRKRCSPEPSGRSVSGSRAFELARTPRAELEAKLKSRPDDGPTVSQYVQKVRMEVLPLIYSATDRAEGSLKSAKAFLDGVRPRVKEETAKKAFEDADRDLAWLQHSHRRNKASRQTGTHAPHGIGGQAEGESRRRSEHRHLRAEAVDGTGTAGISGSRTRRTGPEVGQDVPGRPAAEGQGPSGEKSLEGADQSLSRLQSSIDRAKQRAALVGKDAAPLEVEAWVNGDPLTAADLKGKVVLLDFWAVWFGPSIAAFPHLRQWQEKYADKGLVIVGLTRYFNYTWDEKAGRPVRAQGKENIAPEKEREMLVKFAEHHKLRYRFAIQKGDTLADYYVVHRIPHFVLIDRQGKIRLIRTGGDPRNATDIQQMLEQLLANGD